MKIIIDKKSFVKSLGRVQSIVERRHSIPILANVKIEASDGIVLSTTDRDLFVTDKIDADVERPGGITLPVHTLFEIIKKIPDDSKISLSYKAEDNNWRALIEADSVKCALPGMPIDEFPNFASEEYSSNFPVHSNELYKLLVNTRYAISSEETRYYLNGVYLHNVTTDKSSLLRAVATDSHRLVVSEIESPNGARNIPDVIIPKKAVTEMVKLLEEEEGEIYVSVSSTKFMIKVGSTTLTSKLIDRKFPDYSKAIPTQNDKRLEVGTKQLANAIDLVTTISSDKVRAVKMNITSSTIRLSTSSTANGGSNASQEIEANYNHEPMEIAFNGRYILDILGILNSQVTLFSLSGPSGAVIIQDPTDKSSSHVLMPMQV